MLILNINGTDYKIKYGYNSFCDTDLMDRTKELLLLFREDDVQNEEDVSQIGKVKDLFICVRELLFVGMQKYNPAESLQAVGDLLDDYKDGETEDDKRDLLTLFTKVAGELMNAGFLGDLMKAGQNQKTTRNRTKKTATAAITEVK